MRVLEVYGQLRLFYREMARTTADGCTLGDGSSELGRTSSLQVVVGVKPDNQTSISVVFKKIVIVLMGCQQEEAEKLNK